MFPHPALLLLIDSRSGHVVKKETMAWWPLVNGRQFTPFAPAARGAAVRFRGEAGARLRIGELIPVPLGGAGRPSRPSRHNATAAGAPPAPGSRIIEIGDFNAPESGPNFAAWSRFALTETGQQAIKVYDAPGLASAIGDVTPTAPATR